MQLEIFTLCDAATEHAGKLNIIGTFDALRALEAPIAHPQCAIAGRLRFEQIEEGNHRVSLTFADEDGNIVMPKFDSTLAVHFGPGLRTVTSHFVMVLRPTQSRSRVIATRVSSEFVLGLLIPSLPPVGAIVSI